MSVRATSSNGATTHAVHPPKVSQRVLATDPPVIVKTNQLMAQAPPSKQVMSLAQGIVHWQPPPAAMAAAADLLAAGGPAVNRYGPAEGLPALREALRHKLATKNGLQGYDVMVTAGANQAFVNLVCALVDEGDPVVLFAPYYFNHVMALQMTGGADKVLLGPCDPDSLHPDLTWLQQQLQGPQPPRMVVLVNPCNPTGVLLPRSELETAAQMCASAGCWLVLDNTYEDFVYGGRSHTCLAGPNVVNVFSFSKAYGMMGWRVGYIAYPGQELLQQFGGVQDLAAELLKVQDTIAVCASQLSQHIALAALQQGGSYLQEQLAGLAANQAAIEDALSPLGSVGHDWVGGEGAIYYWARLPAPSVAAAGNGKKSGSAGSEAAAGGGGAVGSSSSSSDAAAAAALAAGDEAVVEWLIQEHGVCIIPGSACGAPGYVRVAFANLTPEQCSVAAGRLKAGLQQLVRVSGAAAGAGAGVPTAAQATVV